MKSVKKVFDTKASDYDDWYETEFGRSAFRLELKVLEESKSPSLEIGVGTGRFSEKLGVDYGVDISKEVLKLAKEKNIKVVTGQAEQLPFKNNKFQSVYLIVTICFVKNPKKVVNETKRILQNQGTIQLGLILKESPWAEHYKEKAEKGNIFYKNAKFYSKKYIEKLLKENNFKNIEYKSIIFQNPKKDKLTNETPKKGYHKNAGFTRIKATLKK